jgi:tetratricopeptide (TPR) repeat protein
LPLAVKENPRRLERMTRMLREVFSPGSQPLFGRDREVAELKSALHAAEGGKGALLLFVGEPGIGKTTLANDFANIASARGARVTWGRAWEAGGAPAYWPWIEALRPFAALTATASENERKRIAPLAHLLPELEGCAAPKPAADPAQDRFQLFEAVAAFLALLARDRPLVILLDDVHVADVGSLLLLHFVARQAQRSPVIVVAAYRDAEARLSAEAGEALAKVAREGRYLALRRLARDEVASWAATEGVDDADAIFDATEGNPLFVVEMLRLARDRGSAARLSGRLPDGVRDVIRARLALLSPPARALLDAGSVLGRTLDLGIAASLVDLPLAAARDLADEAVRSNALVDDPGMSPAGGAGDRTSFSHILIREVLYRDLTAIRRAELHARVAHALLDRHGDDPDASLAEAVHHLFAAEPIVPPDEAITWARRGAERAARRLGFEEAAELLSRATERLPAGRDAEKCDLLLELAGARIGAGQATLGREMALTAANIARRLEDPERLARAALRYGSVFVIAQVHRVLIGLIEEALAALPAEDSPLRARLLARLAAALQPAEDPEHPIILAREAIEMARTADESTRLEVLVAGTSAMLYFADPRERLPLDRELVTLATRASDRLAMLRGLMRLVFDQLELGDPASADRTIGEYDDLSRAVDLPAFRWRAPVMRAMRAMMVGKYEAAEALCAEAAAIAARVDDANAAATLAMHAFARAYFQDKLDEVEARLPGVLDHLARATDPFYQRAFRAGMLTRLGRPEEARDDLESLVLRDPPLRARPMHVWLADACLALGHAEAAARLVTALEPLSQRRFGWSPFPMVMDGRPIASWIERLTALAARRPVTGVAPVAAPRSTAEFEMIREGDHWTIRADTTFHLRDSRGLSILATLVEHPGREFHATDLVAPGGEPGHVEDAGDVLDARAIAAYKQRLEDLREAEAEATRHNDTHRAARAREEIDALASELAQGTGLGGRSRKASSTAEKARINVRKRLLDAFTRIGEHSPALGKHLRRSIKTGIFCSYEP